MFHCDDQLVPGPEALPVDAAGNLCFERLVRILYTADTLLEFAHLEVENTCHLPISRAELCKLFLFDFASGAIFVIYDHCVYSVLLGNDQIDGVTRLAVVNCYLHFTQFTRVVSALVEFNSYWNLMFTHTLKFSPLQNGVAHLSCGQEWRVEVTHYNFLVCSQ